MNKPYPVFGEGNPGSWPKKSLDSYDGAQACYDSFKTGTQALSVFNGQPVPNWMWNGKFVSLEQMANNIFGDTQEKTLFILKHTK